MTGDAEKSSVLGLLNLTKSFPLVQPPLWGP
jgi:hypothetical protein